MQMQCCGNLEHPFTEPPKKQDVPAADEDAVSSEVAETSTDVSVSDSDEIQVRRQVIQRIMMFLLKQRMTV